MGGDGEGDLFALGGGVGEFEEGGGFGGEASAEDIAGGAGDGEQAFAVGGEYGSHGDAFFDVHEAAGLGVDDLGRGERKGDVLHVVAVDGVVEGVGGGWGGRRGGGREGGLQIREDGVGGKPSVVIPGADESVFAVEQGQAGEELGLGEGSQDFSGVRGVPGAHPSHSSMLPALVRVSSSSYRTFLNRSVR